MDQEQVRKHYIIKAGFVDPIIVSKPWGSEEWHACNDKYVMKILNVHQGECLSLQYHEQKDETLMVLEGICKLTFGTMEATAEFIFKKGQTLHIPPGTVHRFEAITHLRLVEASTPQLWDVVRLEDKYGRQIEVN
jgi:mannose-6-phosphate isomerase